MTNSQMITATLFDGKVRVCVLNTKSVLEEGKRIHGTCHTVTAALGRALTAGVMLTADFKEDNNRLSLIINGDGPLGKIIVDANHKVHLKADIDFPVVNMMPRESDGKLDVGGAVGNDGYFRVIKDIGLKEPYIGTVNLVSGEIGDDLSEYFFFSEQIPSAVAVGVLVSPENEVIASGGLLAQLLPGYEEEHVVFLEALLESMEGGISKWIKDYEDPKELLAVLLRDEPYTIGTIKDISYVCECNKEKLLSILASIGREEIESLIEEGGAELTCHFCKTQYHFTGEELSQLLES